MMGYEAFGGWGWGGMVFGGLMMVFWLALLVGVVVLISKWVNGDQNRDHRDADAMDTLNHRLATGEIEPDEFEERARRLRTPH